MAGNPKILWEILEAQHGSTFIARPGEYTE
jgi:hypothetical protein